ncbi:ubiquinol-cytochrome C chaperone family protein [Lichenifustis flavocetrariae]|uniref:Ubiquinol-cytochrome C chaperone n=1 Tax=Lichenifustis flavocetrariae TaxID=2949735 RepID=A0AA42CKM5_9HYPH|nr:ubiquinol-cytochrome C chaperone family protein [Lichenifustis flavocetrariae]MCW6510728.1 ubiquinol-cytochrome C chaperone [Lichenifustis flavocetrariae]
MRFLFARASATPLQAAADRMHDALVHQIRTPFFYTDLHVPDTFEGRFDLLVLHAALVLRRLRDLGPDGQSLAQALVDLMFTRFDVALRELGVSDIGVPKRMKRLAEAFKGRTAAYEDALQKQDEPALRDAICRNVLGGTSDGTTLSRYAGALEAALQSTPMPVLQQHGGIAFPDPARFVSR